MSSDTVLYQSNPAMFRCSPARFILFCGLCLVGIGIPLLLIWWLRCKCTTLTITQQKVILRKGILSKELNEVRHDHVRNVQMRQGLLQRMLDVGWIGISTAGQGGIEIEIDGIPKPSEVKSLIDSRTS